MNKFKSAISVLPRNTFARFDDQSPKKSSNWDNSKSKKGNGKG